jgi:hypothetical protein
MAAHFDQSVARGELHSIRRAALDRVAAEASRGRRGLPLAEQVCREREREEGSFLTRRGG